MCLQVCQRLLGMPAAFQRRIIRKHNFTCLVCDECLASGHKELFGDAKGVEHPVARIAEQRIGEPVIGLEFFVAPDGTAVDADDDRPCLDEVAVPVAETAGFLCTDHAFVLGVEEDHQAVAAGIPGMFRANIVPAVEEMAVLIREGECRHGIAYGQLFVPAAASPLAGGYAGEDQQHIYNRKALFHYKWRQVVA